MALFKVVNNQAQLDAGDVAGTDVYGAGIRFTQAGAARVTRFAGTAFNQGIPMSPTGQVAIVDATAGLPAGAIYLNGLPISNNRVCVSLNASSVTSSGLPFDSNGALVGSLSGFSTLALDFTGSTTLDPRITFSRTSNATLTDSNGRVAYAPHNLLTNSEAFETWIRSSSTVTSNAVVAEDGTTTGDTVVSAAATAITGVYTGATFAAGTYTQSIYVKQATNVRYVQLLWTSGVVSNEWANFDLQTGTLTGGTYTAANITLARNGWYRLTLTSVATASAGDGPWIIAVTSGSAGRGATYPGNGTDSFSVWGAQLNVANAPVNLLTFSEQFDNAAWTKAQLITAGMANVAVAPNGTITADKITENTATDTHYVYQTPTFLAATYTFSVYIKAAGRTFAKINCFRGSEYSGYVNLTSGAVTSLLNGATITTTNVGNDWWLCSMLFTVSVAGGSDIGVQPAITGNNATYTGNGTDGIFIWGAQLNTGSTALPYVATTSSIYLPPSYNSTTPKNLLGFTQEFDNAAWTKSNSFVQTNLVPNSEQFDLWALTAISVAANNSVAPNGTTTADTITADGTTNRHGANNTATIASGQPVVFSAYVKAGTNDFVQLATNSVQGNIFANFQLSTATAGTTSASTTSSITSVGNGWYRLTVGFTTTSALISEYHICIVSSNSAPNRESNNLSTTLLIWGAQLVQGSVPGDYQVTTSAAAAVQYSDPNGTRTAELLVSTAGGSLIRWAGQTVTPQAGASYAFSFYAKADTHNFIQLLNNGTGSAFANFDLQQGVTGTRGGNTTSSISNIGNGWYRCTAVFDTGASLGSGFRVYLVPSASSAYAATLTASGTESVFLWGAQLSNSASVDPYVYNPQAAPTSTAYYGPRFDYNPVTLAANGLLIEQQSTNLSLYSEQFDDASWTKGNSSITVNATVAPDGLTTADKLVEDTATSTHRVLNGIALVVSTTAPTAYSVYAKAAERTAVRVTDNDLQGADFDLLTGATSNISAGATAEAKNVGNGWWRLSIVRTCSTVNGRIVVNLLSAGATSYTGNGTSGAFIWGAQVEAGAVSTSYIPTVASQVTRAADNASMLGDNFATWYQQAQGSWAASWIPSVVNGSVIAQISASTNADRFQLLNDSTGQVAVTTASVGQGSIDAGTVNAGAINKLAYAYQTNNTAASLNAGAAATDNTVTLPTVDRLCIGATVLQQGHLNGAIRSISYYPTRLADTTLTSITS